MGDMSMHIIQLYSLCSKTKALSNLATIYLILLPLLSPLVFLSLHSCPQFHTWKRSRPRLNINLQTSQQQLDQLARLVPRVQMQLHPLLQLVHLPLSHPLLPVHQTSPSLHLKLSQVNTSTPSMTSSANCLTSGSPSCMSIPFYGWYRKDGQGWPQ